MKNLISLTVHPSVKTPEGLHHGSLCWEAMTDRCGGGVAMFGYDFLYNMQEVLASTTNETTVMVWKTFNLPKVEYLSLKDLKYKIIEAWEKLCPLNGRMEGCKLKGWNDSSCTPQPVGCLMKGKMDFSTRKKIAEIEAIGHPSDDRLMERAEWFIANLP